MDEKQLNDMLSAIKAPAPSNDAKGKALEAAMAAFDKNSQASESEDRLTDKGSQPVRRFLMQKRYALSSFGGAVALTAMFVILGSPFILHEMADMNAEVNKSNVASGGDVRQTVGQVANDPEYAKKVAEMNRKNAEDAKASGASEMPVPIAPAENQTLTLPVAPPASKGDPLAEWRAKTEAKRVKMEQEQAPEEKEAPQSQVAGRLQSGKAQFKPDSLARAPAARPEMDASKDAEVSNSIVANEPAPADELAKQKKMPAAPPTQEAAPIGSAVGGAAPMRADDKDIARRIVAQPPVVQPVPAPAPGIAYNNGAQYYDRGEGEFPSFEDNPVVEVSADPVSTFSLDVDTSSYSFVRREINSGTLPSKNAVRIEEMINYFPYDYALPGKNEDPFKPTVAVYNCPWKDGDKLIHIGIKGYDIAEKPQSNIVFLIDTSGSMNEPDKLPLLVASFKLMLDSLSPNDMVSIVTYAGEAGVRLEPTKASDKSKIVEVLDSLRAYGSTYGSAGIQTAYDLAERNFIKGGNNRVILATDGDFNVGISDQSQLKTFVESKRDKGIYLSAMGFGMGDYHDTTMQTLAQNGNGNAAYIDNLNESRKVLVEEASSTLFTIAKDVKIQVEFNPARVQEYRLIGYETRHLNREDFNNDKIDAGEVGAGHSVTAIYEVTPVGGNALVDGLRYAPKAAENKKAEEADKPQFSDELAFLKIRYKRPDENTSHLMTRPITSSDERKFNDLPDDIRFAAAVAGFGQLLRESKYTNTLTWDQVIDMANNARGKDEFGYRAEFVNLVRLAKSEAGTGQPVPANR
jgi:Ca-activated chloride channel homolog